MTRKIIHIDMDAFFASVEQRDHPEWRGKPVVVGGQPNSRGVVAAASYEARRFGIHSAMPSAHAGRLCPEAIFVKPDFARYKAASARLFDILHAFSDLVEPLSIDEAYLDVTEPLVDLGSATAIAQAIRDRVRLELDLTCSAGVAPNKFLAKIASDMDKPDGCFVISPKRVEAFLIPLPVRKVPGIGPATEARLHDEGIQTVGDLRRYSEADLVQRFGQHGQRLFHLAWGRDDRPVRPNRERKSVGIEDTFGADVRERADAERLLRDLAGKLHERLVRHGARGRTITLKVKYADFTQITRATTIGLATDQTERIAGVVIGLLDQTRVGRQPVRLLGITVSKLERPSDDQPHQAVLPMLDDAQATQTASTANATDEPDP